MPHLITLEWPQAGMQITLELGQIEINPTTVPPDVWQVPNKEPLYTSYDIGAHARPRVPREHMTRESMTRENPARVGHVRLDSDGSSAVRPGISDDFGTPSPEADRPLRPAVGRISADADNAQEWNKPIEPSQSPADSRDTQAPSRGFGSSASDPGFSSSNRPAPATASPALRDPFASEPAWSN